MKLRHLSTDELLVGLRKGALQIAILVRASPAMMRGLHFEELARDQIRLAVPPGHPFARRRSISIARTANEPLVAYSRKDYPDYHELLATLFAPNKSRPRIVEEHEGVGGLVTGVEAGTGLALVVQSLSCSIGPRLKLIPLSPAPEPIIIGAAWSRERFTPAAEQFFRCAKSVRGTV